ncbi:uncharacterized protein LOC106663296 isoform X1 [Cimex lectularius]|uniref:CHHC U11-48K-type domain-containing protein n=3 Tax=Cimex lectularius TaxID=79782 RepID=A0A8I6TIB5_CIMLE|nr:uncharacterized protein LOC106663296 isoform X1 [Cimex lectularius]
MKCGDMLLRSDRKRTDYVQTMMIAHDHTAGPTRKMGICHNASYRPKQRGCGVQLLDMYHYDPMIKCPYNQAHVVRTSRMPMHLRKCGMQAKVKLSVCPFNAIHVMDPGELEQHEKDCPDRLVLDSFIYDLGDSTAPEGVLPVTPSSNFQQNSTECWDDCMISENVLEVVKENAQKKDVVINLIGAPPAARKAHRRQETLRRQEIRNKAEAELKAKQQTLKAEVTKNENAKLKEQAKASTSKNKEDNVQVDGCKKFTDNSQDKYNLSEELSEELGKKLTLNEPGPSSSRQPHAARNNSKQNSKPIKYNEKAWLKPIKIGLNKSAQPK